MSSMNCCCISVATSATAPFPTSAKLSPPNNQYLNPSQLEKKKPLRWIAAAASLDSSSPVETSRLRKYWGGEEEDPLSSDDFIWNKDFFDRFKRMIRESDPSPDSPEASQAKDEPSGFLSLNRVMSLNSMEVDLSKELTAPSRSISQETIGPLTQDGRNNLPRWRLAPTRREQDKWDRARKAATGGSDVMFRELRRAKGDPNVLAAQSRKQYFQLKRKLQLLTLGIGGVGLVSAYVSYSLEITVSFGAGVLGSLMYIRMLGSSIDSMADGAKGLTKGSIGQPRLLVPVVLVMIFNRWNGILVPEYGCIQLELIPMLVGFFTYKIATLAQAIEESLTVDGNNS
ncbi:hypothetical protein SAY86_016931 [Trapa natans]|uniref:CGL160/ATPI domain-containing protein n=1 Tax=Trapa natans TaxID=22666 RepID=A0AAN7LPM3_TRANT|nr:hypothetical protein SAY86_016931 [Trapa natans]